MKGDGSYTDNFGGVYIDEEGYLNIEIVGKVQSSSGYYGQVKYWECAFSYNYLMKIQNAMVPIMIEYNIYFVGVKESLNKVDVCIENEESINLTVTYLQELGIYNEAAMNFITTSGGWAVLTAGQVKPDFDLILNAEC